MNSLVPVGTIDTQNVDPMDAIANPDVVTLLHPTASAQPYHVGSSRAAVSAKMHNVKSSRHVFFAPPDLINYDNNDDVDFQVWNNDDLKVSLPTEVDTDKILLTDDGDVQLTEPDNMQVEEKPLTALSDGTILSNPPEPQDMEVAQTRNLILKRKGPKTDQVANNKMIKNDFGVTVRDVVPYSNSESILPNANIKHPIQKKNGKRFNNC